MKKLVLLIMLFAVPMFGFAQTSGGQMRRPVKKQQTTGTTTHKKKENKKMVGNVSKRNGTKSRVLQNLIKKMVYVEGGTFMMGATSEQGSDAYDRENPAHQVTLSSFSIGKYEVTHEIATAFLEVIEKEVGLARFEHRTHEAAAPVAEELGAVQHGNFYTVSPQGVQVGIDILLLIGIDVLVA